MKFKFRWKHFDNPMLKISSICACANLKLFFTCYLPISWHDIKLKLILLIHFGKLTLSRRRQLSYRNQSIDLQSNIGFYMITASVIKELSWLIWLWTKWNAHTLKDYEKKIYEFTCSNRLVFLKLFSSVFELHIFKFHICTPSIFLSMCNGNVVEVSKFWLWQNSIN